MISVIPEDRSMDTITDCGNVETGVKKVCLYIAQYPVHWTAQSALHTEWEASGPNRVHRHVSDPGEGVKGEDLRRKHWATLTRLRTGVGRHRAPMKKWGQVDSAARACGEPEQTADHIINS